MRFCSALIASAALADAGCAPPATLTGGDTSFTLVVAGTTDVHGRIRGWNYESNGADEARGLARAATIVDSLRRSAPGRFILLDAGDLLQGNSLTYVAARVSGADAPHPVIAAMNAMRYDAAAIGNHEFNYGLPLLDRAIAQARFPFLAANARRPDGQRAYPAWTMVERNGVHIGIVGATTPGSMVWDRDNLGGQLIVGDIVPAVREAVSEVRTAGADVVVLTVHSGLDGTSSYDTVGTGIPSENVAARVAREVSGLDLILYGHTHQEVTDTLINGVLLFQPRNWATSVGVAELGLTRANGRWVVARKSSRVIRAASHVENADVLAATDEAHRATVAWVNQPLGHTAVTWRADSARVADTPLVDFILEVERRAAGSDLASTAVFSTDASLDSGVVTAAQLQALYPYDNTLRAIRISGKQLRDYLEWSARYYRAGTNGSVSVDPAVPGYNYDIVAGADYVLDVSRPVGQRVTSLSFKGRPVAATDSFAMALNNYRQTGGGGYSMLSGAPVVYDRQQEIRQLLIDEVRRKGAISPDDYFTRNWSLKPANAVASLYAELRREKREDAPATGIAMRRGRPSMYLRVIGVNDFHGALEPRPDSAGRLLGGAAFLASAIRTAAAGCVPPACETLLVDAGDEFQGTPASNLAFGRPVVAIFNQLGVGASAIGNHEFDWGQDTLRARMRDARYAMLAANVRYADGRPVPWIRSDTLIVRGVLKVGVIGVATTETPATTMAANVADLRFLNPAPIVDSLARVLRKRGADYVIVLAHAGASCDYAAAPQCSGEIVNLARTLQEPVDVIVSGHTHTLVNTAVNGIPVVQARSSGRAVETVDLGPEGPTTRVLDVVSDSLSPDPAVATIVNEAVSRVAPLVSRPIAVFASDLNRAGNQYALGNLLADALRSAGGGDVAVVNNGGIRANIRAGQATYGSLFEVAPFGNVLYRVTVTGRTLLAYLERLVARPPHVHVSGVTLAYDSTHTSGTRLVSARLTDGREIRDDAAYTAILTDFLLTGGDGLGLGAAALRTEALGIVDLDAIIRYVRSLPQPVRAPAEPRITAAETTP